MRSVLVSLAIASFIAVTAPAAPAATATASPTVTAASPIVALQVPDKQIEITVGDRGSARWYRSPVWIAIGALSAVVVLLLVILAVRGGGGTTIVKD